MSKATLVGFVGPGALQGLVANQPSGASCAYYLDRADRAGRAFQLCFSASYALVEKAVISTSGAGTSGSPA